MKILLFFLLIFCFLVGCGVVGEIPENVEKEKMAEEEVEEGVEILEISVDFYSSLFGKTLDEVLVAFEGEVVDYRGEPTDRELTIFYYGKRVGVRFENGVVEYFVFFHRVSILGFETAKDTSEEQVLEYFGEPAEKGVFLEKGTFYEYYLPEHKKLLTFFFTPHYEDVNFSFGLLDP